MENLIRQGDGALIRDRNNVPIQVAGYSAFQDANGIVSPRALTAEAMYLDLPENCAGVMVGAESGEILYGDNSTMTGTTGAPTATGSNRIPSGGEKLLARAAGGRIYFRARTTSATLWFEFIKIGKAE